MEDLDTRSQEMFALYEKLDAIPSLEEEAEGASRTKSLEAIYGASQWRLMWRKFIRNRVAVIGGIVILLFYLTAAFAPFLAPYTETTRYTKLIYMPPQAVHLFNEGKLQPFVYAYEAEFDENLRRLYDLTDEKTLIRFFAHGEPYELFGLFSTDLHLFLGEDGDAVSLLGTDRQGRDMFSRILYGSRLSLTIGLVGVSLSLILGTVLGVTSGYYGSWVDEVIQRLIELIRAIPSVPLWMALSAAIPLVWSITQTYFAISVILSLTQWTWLARQLRGQVLPATLGQIIVVSTLAMPSMILAETALSYLGLGLRPPATSWGVLIQESQNYQSLALYPWVFTPAAAVALCILAFNYLGDGLRDAVDPYTI
jgi:peptide/nickel transport system permease protein